MALSLTYIGHATTLINLGGKTIITDPNFGKFTLFFPRRTDIPLPPENLPPLSAVLLSHTHHDHLHLSSYKYISSSVPVIVPEGCEGAIGGFIGNPVIELSRFANHELADGTIITAVPNQHSARSASYLIRRPADGFTVFFCADSAYGPHFREISQIGSIDIAMLPIGGYEPRIIFRRSHMTPAEAVQAFEDLGARHMIPVHHGTFRFSLEGIDAPLLWLRKIIEIRPDLASKIHPLTAGENFNLKSERFSVI